MHWSHPNFVMMHYFLCLIVTHTHTPTHAHTCTRTHTYTHTHVCRWESACEIMAGVIFDVLLLHTHTHTRVNVHTHTFTYTHRYTHTHACMQVGECPWNSELDCGFEISEFELQSNNYIPFQTKTLEKGINTLFSSYCLNSITAPLL